MRAIGGGVIADQSLRFEIMLESLKLVIALGWNQPSRNSMDRNRKVLEKKAVKSCQQLSKGQVFHGWFLWIFMYHNELDETTSSRGATFSLQLTTPLPPHGANKRKIRLYRSHGVATKVICS